jgi:PAS domain S-box-containing protein
MKVGPPLRNYGLAVISCGVALAVAWRLDAVSSCFILAVMVSSLYGGRGPGLLSVVLSALAYAYFFTPPIYSLAIDPPNYGRFAIFLGAILLIAGLVEAKRRVEESHREINARYRTIADTAPDAIVSIDGGAQILFVNPAVTRIFGWGESELIGQPLMLLLPEFRFADRLGSSESMGRRKDGTEFSAEVAFGTAPDGQSFFTGFVRDISERKQAEAALRKSEFYLAEAQRLGHAGSWAWDANLGTAYWSTEMFRIFGLSPTSRPPAREDRPRFFARPVWARILDVFERAKQEKSNFDDEFPFIFPDGSNRMIRIVGQPVIDTAGDVEEFVGTMIDVTEQHQARAALQKAFEEIKRSEDQLRLMVDTIPGLVCVFSSTGELELVNQPTLEYTGMIAGDHSYWPTLVHRDDVEPTRRLWRHSMETGDPFVYEYRLRRSDGVYRWFHVRALPLHNNQGHIVRWYGLATDIEDRKNTEEALRKTEARLSRATQLAAVGELAAAIAHEVNQPLSAVVANGHACLRWLRADPPNLEKARQAAERIARDGKDAGEVVKRIRALFKRTAGEFAALDLNEVIGEVLHLLRSDAVKRRVVVETDLDKTLPCVMGDRIQLQQVLVNLLLNGMEAMDSVTLRPRKLIVRSARESADGVVIAIRDNGIGMEDPEKIFESFFTTKENGMGMGLAISRSIIDAHHGRLWVADNEGLGATVCFAIPFPPGESQ